MVDANQYLIGCSGYYYPQWKNTFYPPKLASAKWLEYYSTVFNTVELNGTFYRVPKLSDLKKYHAVTTEGFTFSVKMNKYVTHTLRLKDTRTQIEDFKGLIKEGLSNKLTHILFQFPASFKYSEETLSLILDNIGKGVQNVIEFRHVSWWNDVVMEAFKNANLTFCNVDYPGLQPAFLQTSEAFYLRLHGTPDLFKSSYTEAQLMHFSSQIPESCTSCSIYCNNTYYDAAYQNAFALKEILRARQTT